MKNNPDKKVHLRQVETAMLTLQKEQFENKFKKPFQLVFINIGLGKQKTAKNFVVSLNEYMAIEKIAKRMENGFGDI